MLSETVLLRDTIRASSSQHLSTKAAAAIHSASSLENMNKDLLESHTMLGMYRSASMESKRLQNALATSADVLMSELREEEATHLLLKFDESWWELRSKLDNYFDASSEEYETFATATSLLDDYTSK